MLLSRTGRSEQPSRSRGSYLPGVRLKALVEAQDLTCTGGRHRSAEEGVPQAMLGDLLLQPGPIPEVGGSYAPEVVLELALAGRRAFVRLIGAIDSGDLAGSFESSVIDGFENLLVEQPGLRAVEGHAQSHEGISEALDTDADGTVAHVGLASLGNGVVVDVDDAVQVERDHLGDVVKLLEVVRLVGADEGGERDGSEVADGDLIRRGVLDDLRAEVGRLNGAKVLLIGFAWIE